MFVGSGAPKGKELELPGRHDTDRIHIGIDWLESVAFGHIDKIGERVLIIGVGNTAMDCCRTSLRLGAKSVKVMARKPRGFFKASDWELEDAEDENVEIVVNHSPKAFVIENGKLTGMLFDKMEYELEDGRITAERVLGEELLPCDDVILAIGQENAFPWIERDLGIEFDKWNVPKVDASHLPVDAPGRVLRRRRRLRPQEHHLGGRARPPGRDLDPPVSARASRWTERPARGVKLGSRKMGMHEWAYSNDYNAAERRLVPHVSLKERFKKINIEVELGFTRRAGGAGSAALPQLRRADGVRREAVHRVRRLHRHLPGRLPDDHAERHRGRAAHAPEGAGQESRRRRCTCPRALPQTARVMVKDEDLCVHCGLCAERCPTAAWDMQKSTIHWPHAGRR